MSGSCTTPRLLQHTSKPEPSLLLKGLTPQPLSTRADGDTLHRDTVFATLQAFVAEDIFGAALYHHTHKVRLLPFSQSTDPIAALPIASPDLEPPPPRHGLTQEEIPTYPTRPQQEKPNLDIIRTTNGYSLPEAVASYVSFVGELIRFPYVPNKQVIMGPLTTGDPSFEACGAACAGYTTPEVLQERCVHRLNPQLRAGTPR